MNKKYDRTDQERDQSRRLEQGEAERKNAREESMPGRGGRQQAGGERGPEPGGRTTGKERVVDEP